VKVRSGGDYLRKVLRSSITVIKIDVEGMEGEVLESLEPLLREKPPRVICFESDGSETPFYDRRPVRCLTRLGYQFEQVKHGVGLHRRPTLVPVPVSGPIYNSHDFVALRSSSALADFRLKAERFCDKAPLSTTTLNSLQRVS
jgi:hypothetical protein